MAKRKRKHHTKVKSVVARSRVTETEHRQWEEAAAAYAELYEIANGGMSAWMRFHLNEAARKHRRQQREQAER